MILFARVEKLEPGCLQDSAEQRALLRLLNNFGYNPGKRLRSRKR